MENELYTAEIKAVKVDPKHKTFLIEAWIDGFGPVWDQFDAWDYVGIFDGIGLTDLIGREVRVKMKPNAYEFVEVVRSGEEHWIPKSVSKVIERKEESLFSF